MRFESSTPTNLNFKIMYKKATRTKLRVQTSKGLLTVEQLWDLKLTELVPIVKEASEAVKASNDTLDFLSEEKKVDEVAQLKFEILKDIYLTKKAELDEARIAREKKAHNERIMNLIAEAEDAQLRNKTPEELRSLLKQ